MNDSACFSCVLPDCDDRHRDCLLRRAANRYASASRAKREISEADREARNEFFMIWKGEREAKRSESERA